MIYTRYFLFISESGNAFCRAADIHLKLGNRHEAGTQFADAANCFKKTDRNGESDLVAKLILDRIYKTELILSVMSHKSEFGF